MNTPKRRLNLDWLYSDRYYDPNFDRYIFIWGDYKLVSKKLTTLRSIRVLKNDKRIGEINKTVNGWIVYDQLPNELIDYLSQIEG